MIPPEVGQTVSNCLYLYVTLPCSVESLREPVQAVRWGLHAIHRCCSPTQASSHTTTKVPSATPVDPGQLSSITSTRAMPPLGAFLSKVAFFYFTLVLPMLLMMCVCRFLRLLLLHWLVVLALDPLLAMSSALALS